MLFFFRLVISFLLLYFFLSFYCPNFFLFVASQNDIFYYFQLISLVLCKHFGWSVFWFPFAIAFLYKKNKPLLKMIFFLFIPLAFSNLAGILWLGSLYELYYYFGSFAVFSQQLFNNLVWQIVLFIFYLYSLYLILTSYSIIPFWKKLFKVIALLCSNKFLIQNNKKINFLKKIFYKKIFKVYYKEVSNKFLKSFKSQSFLQSAKKQEAKGIKRIVDSENSFQNNSSDNSSLNELLSIFHSISRTKKSKE